MVETPIRGKGAEAMDDKPVSGVDPWARLRFSIIGGLLACPPSRGELGPALEKLAAQRYRHPSRADEWVTFGASTIERWYYKAVGASDPIAVLARKVRGDAGHNRAMKPALLEALGHQYRQHRGWSYQLHFDNLAALVTTMWNADVLVLLSNIDGIIGRRESDGRRLLVSVIDKLDELDNIEDIGNSKWGSGGIQSRVNGQGCNSCPAPSLIDKSKHSASVIIRYGRRCERQCGCRRICQRGCQRRRQRQGRRRRWCGCSCSRYRRCFC